MKTYFEMSHTVPEGGVELALEGNLMRVYFDFATESSTDENGASCDAVTAEVVDVRGGRTYAAIVAAIVNDRYPVDDTIAILANAGLDGDEKAEEHAGRYAAYQQWRAHAKEVAAAVLAILAK